MSGCLITKGVMIKASTPHSIVLIDLGIIESENTGMMNSVPIILQNTSKYGPVILVIIMSLYSLYWTTYLGFA